MMENKPPAISIVIAVYNAKKTLRRCLDSIFGQSFSNFEIIIVDDGSTDRPKPIYKEYINKYKEIYVLYKDNGGVSSARNLGIEKARGKWIAFVDADDEIDVDYLKHLYMAIRDDVDLAMGGFEVIQKGELSHKVQIKNQKLSPTQAFREEELHRLGSPWAKLYKHSIIKEKKLRFDEEISFAEDIIFLCDFLNHSKEIQLISFCDYKYYIDNNESLSKAKNSFEFEYKQQFQKIKAHLIPYIKYEGIENHLFYALRRAINSIYTSGEAFKRRQRVSYLKMVYNEQGDVFDIIPQKNPYYKYRHNLNFLDAYLRFFFFVKSNFFLSKILKIVIKIKNRNKVKK